MLATAWRYVEGSLLPPAFGAGWSLDEALLAAMEAREDAGLGWDDRNDDTFGDFLEQWAMDNAGEYDSHELGEGMAVASDATHEEMLLARATCTKMLPTRRLQ